MSEIKLDRMALDDVGPNPKKLAEAIHAQLGGSVAPVPVREIALALDIVDIREEPLETFEGALLTDANRDKGSILINRRSGRQRGRFTIAHELLHFLNPRHQPMHHQAFFCAKSDMLRSDLKVAEQHLRQEAEANWFAIELLAPVKMVRPFLRSVPDLNQAFAMAAQLDLSKEASTRRYVELHDESLAVVFGKGGTIRYWFASNAFPKLGVRSGLPLPGNEPGAGGSVEPIDEIDSSDWLRHSDRGRLLGQTALQSGGFSITLLWLDGGHSD